MSIRHLLALPVLVALAAGCSAGTSGSPAVGSADPSSIPSPSSSPVPPTGDIDHPSGPSDVVLRLEEGGGLVPIDFLATQAPTFTLYGDGTVIFRDVDVAFPQPGADGLTRYPPYSTGRLDESEIAELLDFAIGRGGLGLARNGRYEHPMVADAGTTIFDITAGGHDKRVEVYALGFDDPTAPDRQARSAFSQLAERLRHFGQGLVVPPADYVPDRYRGVLFESQGPSAAARPWPWPTIAVADFAADATGSGLPRRTLTADEIAALGIEHPPGGLSGLVLTAPDGEKEYLLSLRPLFPDEEA
jgi:hypothetical protein